MIILALPCLAFAEVDTDLRVKLGSAAGAQRIEFGDYIGHGSDNNGTNAQLEYILCPHRADASFILTMGLFHRRHPGNIDDFSFPTKVEYTVTGISIAPGLRAKLSDAWNFEGKIEIGGSNAGTLTLDSPGVMWNATKKGPYGSLSLIAGWYYLLKNTPSRVGLELGMQTFRGDFEILSNTGSWSRGQVTGTSATVNIVYGIEFLSSK